MVEDLIKRLNRYVESLAPPMAKRYIGEAIDMIEQQSAGIASLECTRIAYASEFAPDAEGLPDVGSIHANIRALKARLTALESERDALLAAAGKEAVKGEPLAWLIDWPDEPDLGHYFGEEPNEFARSVPLYTSPTAALEQGDGRDAETLSALYDLLMCRAVEIGEAYLTLRVVGVPPESYEFVAAVNAALPQQANDGLSSQAQYEDACIAANKNVQDADRYRWMRDTLHGAKAGGGIEVNNALQFYEKPEPGEEVRVYWYQDTPVGFYEVKASTLDEAIDAALSQKAGEQQ